jgi:hypothetical protein
MVSASTDRRHRKAWELYKECMDWSTGTPVTVQRANGTTLKTVTESRPWFDRGGAYVRVRGIPGNTRLDRVTPKGGG